MVPECDWCRRGGGRREPLHVRGIGRVSICGAKAYTDLFWTHDANVAAMGSLAPVEYVDMPEELRPRYQYHTQAAMERLRKAGYEAPFTPLEEGVADYVAGYLNTDDPYL